MKALFIPLKSEFFEKFKSGEKDTEFRVYGPRWNCRTCIKGRKVTLSKGYGKQNRLHGVIVDFMPSYQATLRPDFVACYGAGKTLAACITIKLNP